MSSALASWLCLHCLDSSWHFWPLCPRARRRCSLPSHRLPVGFSRALPLCLSLGLRALCLGCWWHLGWFRRGSHELSPSFDPCRFGVELAGGCWLLDSVGPRRGSAVRSLCAVSPPPSCCPLGPHLVSRRTSSARVPVRLRGRVRRFATRLFFLALPHVRFRLLLLET